jgi:hypothetical protein
MKTYFIAILLLCLASKTFAAFPVTHTSQIVVDTTYRQDVSTVHKHKKVRFAKYSAYSFLITCASIVLVGVLAFFGDFGYTDIWLHGAATVALVSIALALIAVIRGEGEYSRIMLFLSVFFLFILSLFL